MSTPKDDRILWIAIGKLTTTWRNFMYARLLLTLYRGWTFRSLPLYPMAASTYATADRGQAEKGPES